MTLTLPHALATACTDSLALLTDLARIVRYRDGSPYDSVDAVGREGQLFILPDPALPGVYYVVSVRANGLRSCPGNEVMYAPPTVGIEDERATYYDEHMRPLPSRAGAWFVRRQVGGEIERIER